MSQAKQGSFRKPKGTLATYLSLNITVTPKLGFTCAVLAFKERERVTEKEERERVLYCINRTECCQVKHALLAEMRHSSK